MNNAILPMKVHFGIILQCQRNYITMWYKMKMKYILNCTYIMMKIIQELTLFHISSTPCS